MTGRLWLQLNFPTPEERAQFGRVYRQAAVDHPRGSLAHLSCSRTRQEFVCLSTGCKHAEGGAAGKFRSAAQKNAQCPACTQKHCAQCSGLFSLCRNGCSELGGDSRANRTQFVPASDGRATPTASKNSPPCDTNHRAPSGVIIYGDSDQSNCKTCRLGRVIEPLRDPY